jgi:hypothetical protein
MGIHGPDLDEDLGIAGMLKRMFPKRWHGERSPGEA